MNYNIVSGKYETGNEEAKSGYKMLFGEDNIQYKFDLYFHWYNLVHEVGHCIVEKYNLKMSPVLEEMFVNEFAIGYYRYVGESERLEEIKAILYSVIEHMPPVVPEGEDFISYFESIWGTEALMNVMTYGYFQLQSVLEAMEKERDFLDIANELGVSIHEVSFKKSNDAINSSNAEKFLTTALDNLKAIGFDVPHISLKLVDDPMIQCAQNE